MEAVEAGIKVVLATSENVPRHDASRAVTAAREAGAAVIGFNSNGLISPGQTLMPAPSSASQVPITKQGVAQALVEGTLKKPIVALVAGEFQEAYPRGVSFGHVAAMIKSGGDSASEKRQMLREAGASVAATLEEIPQLLHHALALRQ